MSAGLVRSLVAAAGACVLFASSSALAQQSITFAHPSAGELGATIFRGVSGGRAAGFWHNPTTNGRGAFVYDLASGTHSDLLFPGAAYTETTGIGGDQVVGYYLPGVGEPLRAFRYDLSRSTWTEF